jgi:SAM-dependent methyltransferase
MTHVGQFFDKHFADGYLDRDHGMQPFHEVTARKIEAGITGDVLCVGGLWSRGTVPPSARIVIVDLSAAMLQVWSDQGMSTVQADARALPFAGQTFDHVVVPLMLHHVTGESVSEAQTQAALVLAEVNRVLRPNGVCWISEFCVSSAAYAMERAAAPVTRRLLALRGIPLVVMHSSRFYQEVLRAQKFVDIEIEAISANRAHAWDTITPIVGFPWLKVPRVLYPLTPTLIRAKKGA